MAYAAAQMHARLAAAAIEAERRDNIYVAQGRALYQIKEVARVGFMLLPDATDEQFEHRWRTAFQLPAQEQQGSRQ